MKVLVLGMNATVRGELSYESRIIHHLAQQPDVEVDYMVDSELDYSHEPVLKKPERLTHYRFAKGDAALAKTPRTFAPLDIKRIVEKHLLNSKYDIIFGTAQTAIDMGTWLKQVLEIPLVIQILDVPLWRISQFGPSQIYQEAMIRLPLLPEAMFAGYLEEWRYWFGKIPEIDRVTTIMNIVKREMVELGVVGPEKVEVVRHGSIDHDTAMYYLNEEPAEKKNQVMCLNRHTFHKGVDQSIRICELIKQRSPDTKFLFVSDGDQWYTEMLQRYAGQCLGDSVKFLGWVDNATKFRLLRESRVLLDNEWPQGFGGVCLAEAVYCDCIPITWDTPGKLEVSNNGKYVMAVPKGDFAAAAETAVAILNGSVRWSEEKWDEARAWIRENRSVESHAKSLVEIFKKVLNK